MIGNRLEKSTNATVEVNRIQDARACVDRGATRGDAP